MHPVIYGTVYCVTMGSSTGALSAPFLFLHIFTVHWQSTAAVSCPYMDAIMTEAAATFASLTQESVAKILAQVVLLCSVLPVPSTVPDGV